MQAVAASQSWQGWGLDNNTLCPANQVSTTQQLLCEPEYPGAIAQSTQSWTGVTCTPKGNVICVSLPGSGLKGNASAMLELSPLKEMQFINLANNSLAGDKFCMLILPRACCTAVLVHHSVSRCAGPLPKDLPQLFKIDTYACALAVIYLSNNSITGSLPALWGNTSFGWGPTLQRLYLNDNHISGQLPQLWSDSNSLYELGRIDLFGNQLTGSIPWRQATMPSLENLVLLPGMAAIDITVMCMNACNIALLCKASVSSAVCKCCQLC